VQTEYTRGRLALTGHLPLAEAERSAIRLAKERNNPLAQVWAAILHAGLATDRARATELFAGTTEPSERAGMRATTAVLRYRLGELRDDAVLRTAAEADLATLGVRNAARMCTLVAPLRR
jgi:hypothetical protein